jgi:hypothetical protein
MIRYPSTAEIVNDDPADLTIDFAQWAGSHDAFGLGTGARSLPCSNWLPVEGKTGHFWELAVPLA